MRENLDSPSWADSQIPPANSIIGGDWSDKTQPQTEKVPSIKVWPSPASPSPSPVTFHTGSPTPSPFRRSTTIRPDSVTVSQADVSTMRYPGPSPVTPMYSTNFGDYASLDVDHMAGPTGIRRLRKAGPQVMMLPPHRISNPFWDLVEAPANPASE